MKKLVVSLSILVSLFTVSCKKENTVKPQSDAAIKTINVEYRISSQSGFLNASYIKATNEGKFVTVNEQVKGQYYTVDFTTTSGHLLSVEAENQVVSHRTVQVEIYVDGVKVKEGTSSSQDKATASGVF